MPEDTVGEAAALAREAYPDLEVASTVLFGPPPSVSPPSRNNVTVVLGARGGGSTGILPLGSVSLQVVGHASSLAVIANHITTGHGRVSWVWTVRPFRWPRWPTRSESPLHRSAVAVARAGQSPFDVRVDS